MQLSDPQLWLASFLFAALSGFGGVYIAQKSPRWYSEKSIQYFVAVGVGLLLGVVWFEFLPHSLEMQPKFAPYFFVSGLLSIALAEKYVLPHLSFLDPAPTPFTTYQENIRFEKAEEVSVFRPHVHTESCSHGHEGHSHISHSHMISSQAACSVIGCLLLCTFFDGLQLRAAFSIGNHTGWVTLFALLFHVLPDGVVAASLALAGGYTKAQAAKLSLVVSFCLFFGVAAGTFLDKLLPLQGTMLPFAGGILLYVSLIHLFPIAFRTWRGIVLLGIGLVFFGVVTAIAHH